MLHALNRLRRLVAPGQLELALTPRVPAADGEIPRPDEAARLLARLRALGLRGIRRCALTRNRSTMVSFRGDALRLHRAFATAADDVLRAVVGFVNGRGAARRAARRALTAFEIPRDPAAARPHRPVASHPDDAALAARLRAAHAALNGERFTGALGPVAIRVSRRMRSRLGHYSSGRRSAPEIAIARRHARRDGWPSVLETLVHEMVHQWQHETGRPVAHDADFRRKCREVGIAPHAKRPH
ncbi:MAG: SprT-like domain-containing protein [Deltaproteobacteria bacterium]|nr:SprT-like domain-containing protein [Deltaproteobacteria bacterium]